MAAKELLYDISLLDFNRPIAGLEEIRRLNPQRFEMEQLTAILYCDEATGTCVGYKDVTDQEFWVRGHMPGLPLMPGVVMVEAAAQVCSYITQRFDFMGADMVGFGGLEDVRFRDPVVPGDRLIVMCRLDKVRRNRIIVSRFQGVVGENVVVEGVIKGVPIPIAALKEYLAKKG